ncbi:MAG: Ig-like domain-containing protein, partial [Lachnospiraceae bacterium]|nr:Ig-like domain-containing protein [Lachnospiraceae bacterium]
ELKAKSQYCVKIYSEDGQGFGTYSVEVNFKLETKDESATDTTTTDSASTQTTVVSPTKFKLSSQSVKLKKGKKKTIKVVYSPKKAKIKKTTWKSANSKIAKVSKKGVIKAMKKGKTKISCNVVFTDGTKRTLSVTVKVV